VFGGLVLQTNQADIIARVEEQNKLQKSEIGIYGASSKALSSVKSINLPQQIKDFNLPQSIKDFKF
jgi:AP-3 complex subunit sigma